MRLVLAAILVSCCTSAWSQSFDELRSLYQYDNTVPLDLQEKEVPSRGGCRVYSISYAIPHARMAGFLVAPDGKGRKPANCVDALWRINSIPG